MKRRIQILAIVVLIMGTVSLAYAQDTESLQTAFKESYSLENNGEYVKGAEKIKAVYDGDSYEINLRLGWLTYLAGSFKESQAYYQKAMNLKPMAIEAIFGAVYPASTLGNWDQVITLYNKVLEIDPQNTYANYRLGYIYYGREDYQTALSYFEKVINLYPFDYDSLIILAWTNLKLGKLREAKILFNKVLLFSPDDESALEGLELIK